LSLADTLNENGLMMDLRSRQRAAAIEEIVDALCTAGTFPAGRKYELLSSFYRRELEMSTGMGGGLAVPHARVEGPCEPVVVFGRAPDGIDWQSLDGLPARLIVGIVTSRSEGGVHTRLLGALARAVHAGGGVDQLLAAGTREEMVDVLR
jgi:mannitol/fructose-specific phosphotransferase system IIA component (Ntr-type)